MRGRKALRSFNFILSILTGRRIHLDRFDDSVTLMSVLEVCRTKFRESLPAYLEYLRPRRPIPGQLFGDKTRDSSLSRRQKNFRRRQLERRLEEELL